MPIYKVVFFFTCGMAHWAVVDRRVHNVRHNIAVAFDGCGDAAATVGGGAEHVMPASSYLTNT